MNRILLLLLISVSFCFSQWPSRPSFLGFRSMDYLIPTKGLVLLHNPGAQMITDADGNIRGSSPLYPTLTYGSNLVTNGDFHDFTMDNADVEDSVKGHWIFSSVYHLAEIGTDSIHHDLSGLDNDLTWNGWTDYADVKSDMSGTDHPSYENGDTLGFDGATTYWSIPGTNADDINFDSTDFTFEAWVYSADYSVGQAILGKYDDSDNQFYYYITGNEVRAYSRQTANTRIYYQSSDSPLTNGSWHHIAFVADRDVAGYIYVDGVVSSTYSQSTMTEGNSDVTADFQIGSLSGSNIFNGSIAEVRFTKSALSANDIMCSYGLAKGWIDYGSGDEIYINNDFAQGIKRVGTTEYFGRVLGIADGDCHEFTFDAWVEPGGSFSKVITGLMNTGFWNPPSSPTSYKYYGKEAGDLMRLYGGDAGQYNYYDNLSQREVTNVSAPDSVVTDYSGQGNTGYPISDMEDEQPAHPYAWIYDGTADYLDYGDILDFGTNDWMWCGWVKSTEATSDMFISKYEDADNRFFIGTTADDSLHVWGEDNTTEAWQYKAGTISNAEWTFISVVGDRDVGIKVFYNGVEKTVYEDVAMKTTDMDNAGDLLIGRYNTTYFAGRQGLQALYLFDGLSGRSSALLSNYETAIIQKIYNNTSIYYSDD